jgi:hypothetical protein
MENIIVLIVFFLYGISMSLSYNDSFRNTWYYVPVCVSFSLVCGTMWAFGTRITNGNERLLMFSLAWEFSVILVDIIVPYLIYGITPTRGFFLGSMMVVVGMVIMKLSMRHP